jgi:hypothetical protein
MAEKGKNSLEELLNTLSEENVGNLSGLISKQLETLSVPMFDLEKDMLELDTELTMVFLTILPLIILLEILFLLSPDLDLTNLVILLPDPDVKISLELKYWVSQE